MEYRIVVTIHGGEVEVAVEAGMNLDWDNAIKVQHMSIIAWLWHEVAPRVCPYVTRARAAKLWAKFRADPNTDHPGVKAMQIVCNDLWTSHVLTN